MPAMAARGPYAKGLAKREEILEVALAHFAERGDHRASVREVARLAGLTQAGLLHHFSTKEELFLAILQQRDDRYDDPSEKPHSHSVGRLVPRLSATPPSQASFAYSLRCRQKASNRMDPRGPSSRSATPGFAMSCKQTFAVVRLSVNSPLIWPPMTSHR